MLRKDLDLFGKVEMTMPNFILKANNENRKTGYVEDVSSLTKTAKKDLVNHFYYKNGKRTRKSVAYLVRTDRISNKKV